jgi:hypothetical protein
MQAELCATEICRPLRHRNFFLRARFYDRPLRQWNMQADLFRFAPPKYAGRPFRSFFSFCATEICRPNFASMKYAGRPFSFCATEICRPFFSFFATEICRPNIASMKYAGRPFSFCATEICRPTFAPPKYADRPLRQRNVQADLCVNEICRPTFSFCATEICRPNFASMEYAGRPFSFCATEICRPSFSFRLTFFVLRHRNMQADLFRFAPPNYAGRTLRHRNTQANLCASEICRPTFAPAKYAERG